MFESSIFPLNKKDENSLKDLVEIKLCRRNSYFVVLASLFGHL